MPSLAPESLRNRRVRAPRPTGTGRGQCSNNVARVSIISQRGGQEMAVEQEVISRVAEHGARIGGLEKWKDTHETQEHPEIETKLWNLQTRLPNWAVFFISLLTAALGMLATLAAVKGG